MRRILNQLPITRDPVVVRRESLRVKDPQIIVWLSVDVEGPDRWNPSIPRIPAILDTGNTQNLFVRESHLHRWAGTHPASLALIRSSRLGGRSFDLRRANVCLHANQPGERDKFARRVPFFLSFEDGIAVCPDDHPLAPRLPLLGLRSLVSNRLTLAIDGARGEVSLRTARRWWWPF